LIKTVLFNKKILYICHMINFNLAKEIYGLTPWMMDIHSIPVMTSILKDVKNGVRFEKPEIKLNTPYIIDVTSKETRLVSRPWQLRSEETFDAVGVIKIDGPITKSGGESTMGMTQISNIMLSLSRDSRVKSFVLLTDSGGGSSVAVKIMVDTINEVKQSKPVIGLITKGGMASSAAYGIISACDEIYCEDEMSIVGSVGTMIQFEGREANSKDKNGIKHIRLYATKSTKKNEGFEEALNNDNYKILVNNFIGMVSANRPKINSADFDDGRTYFAKEVIGTYIDGIKSFEEVASLSLSYNKKDGKKTKKSESNININNKNMTKAEFKTANPTAYNEIVAEGIAHRTDQVGAWMAHNETDPKAVREGIESGENITATQREEVFVKANSKKVVSEIIEESAEGIETPESLSGAEKLKQEAKAKEVKEAFGFELN
jgi:ClpP class serine protease